MSDAVILLAWSSVDGEPGSLGWRASDGDIDTITQILRKVLGPPDRDFVLPAILEEG